MKINNLQLEIDMKILSFVVRLVLLQAVFLPAFADSLEAVEAERQQLQFEGSRIESACYDRFAVNACLSKWSAERRARAAGERGSARAAPVA